MSAQRPLTQPERTEASRKAIIDAAIKVLAEEGFRNTTVARIQEVAGLSRGLVGYHFGNKRGLMEAVIAAIRDNYVAVVVDSPRFAELSGLDATLAMIDSYLTRVGHNPNRNKVLLVLMVESLGEVPELSDSVRALNALMRRQFRGWLVRGLEDGTIRTDVDPPAEAAHLEGLLRGITLQYLVDPANFDLEGAKRAALTATHHSLQA